MSRLDEPLPFFEDPNRLAKYPCRPAAEVNPNGEPIGPWTGRCGRCGSNDLWDDQTAYGCNNCGAVFSQ